MSENTDVPDTVPDPAIGMTADEVLTSKWGYPKKKNITQTAATTSEQWVYDQGYICLTDGIITAIQKTEWTLNTKTYNPAAICPQSAVNWQ